MINLPRPLKGIIPPVLTPLAGQDALDTASFKRLLEHLIGGGSSGLFILGSTGESPGLSGRLRREVIDCACLTVRDRLPVLVGITDTSFVESVRLAEYSAKCGASALVLSPPYYYGLTQAAFLGYLERLTALLPLPLYLYNMPSFTKIMIEPETVLRASEMPNVFGLKDSSGNREYFAAVRKTMAHKPEFALLIGIEEILADMVAAGAHGGVCGGANLAPRLYADLYQAAAHADAVALKPLQDRVLAISDGVYSIGDPESSYLRGLKCASSLLGFGNGVMAEPYAAMTTAEANEIRKILIQVSLIGDAAYA